MNTNKKHIKVYVHVDYKRRNSGCPSGGYGLRSTGSALKSQNTKHKNKLLGL